MSPILAMLGTTQHVLETTLPYPLKLLTPLDRYFEKTMLIPRTRAVSNRQRARTMVARVCTFPTLLLAQY